MANNLIPLFLSDHTEELEQPVIGKAWHRAAAPSWGADVATGHELLAWNWKAAQARITQAAA
jgi:hypothetical protein